MHSPDRQDLPGTELLRLARASVEYGFIHREPLPVRCDDLHPALTEPAATFTTLRLHGKLRGCCGSLEAVDPLATDVTRSAFRAAYRDSRFEPVGEEELAGLRLEVSVLSPLDSIAVNDEADLLAQLKPGTDGLVIVDGWRRATFLPKVWESLPEPRLFVMKLKNKCGLPEHYWSEQLQFLRYHTTTYAESS
jgi:AmmeMemoRadiSam system protein A